MKKIMTAILMLLCLVGCATEESPEYYFDVALTEVESLDKYTTSIKVTNQDNVTIVDCVARINQDALTYQYLIGSPIIEMEGLATFNYANQFVDFSYNDGVVSCLIPVDSEHIIHQVIAHYTTERIESIEHHMYLTQESLTSCLIKVKTTTQTYTIDITIEKN